ncbi:pyridoxamine 5'-phosphate oxidase [Bacteroidia bacterium]|nr:pyridoxamine 5'-phosphate oxidase [Bacteroidia bacterium]
MEKQLIVNFEKLEKFVAGQKTALVGSVDSEGIPNIKAMLLAKKREGMKVFYFSTNTSSMRAGQFRENPKASIYFYHKGLFKYEGVMLKGVMEVLEDDNIKRELWQRGDKMFYPQGVTDPDYCILKFTAKEGRYYCNLKTGSFPV